jgi:ATP-dependent RNA/DNA helicase IGHMBP2
VEYSEKERKRILQCIELEEKEQISRYALDQQQSLKNLKTDGLAIHPIRVTRKAFGYADYPEISFRIPFPIESRNFRDGSAIECFCQGEAPIKGILLHMDGKQGEFRLFAPDFPDWIEDDQVGIKLAPDSRTTEQMKKAISAIENDKRLFDLFERIHSENLTSAQPIPAINSLNFINESLNQSQQVAVRGMLSDVPLMIIHGPPGTGKTTTLIEGIQQLVKQGKRVLVSAPGNAAVDHLALGLIQKGVSILRIGNTAKVKDEILSYTPEGKLKGSNEEKTIKKLRIRAEELRKMALQYKRNFGRDEREQRNLLMKEVKQIRHEIREFQQFHEEQLYDKAAVILGTPIALTDSRIKTETFHTVIIDEAGQCLEPLAWCIFPFAEQIILAGDHLQLPPTVLSEEAIRLGFNKSILEVCYGKFPNAHLLDTQYRMRRSIAEFSNNYFYEGKIKTIEELEDKGTHLYFYDTAGTGFEESTGNDGHSLINQGEADLVAKLIDQEQLNPEETAVISPYSGQISLLREMLPDTIRVSTIDSFQGQEMRNIIISLVRSNADGTIGFLKDHRRMNVAMTRAKENLFIIADSSTISSDLYFSKFLDHTEQTGAYRSAWGVM